ncbi:hydrolase 2, exosortase A system-associated [Thauera butanivorans]|uniref:hydrolase 2, exosortase A system-associated n=1 Tax=Thauera butanivorans TaxID=86174 RepID=UPI003AB508CB
MSSLRREAFFLPIGGGGQRFCLLTGPAAAQSRGAVLYVHPFAEELNKSRRMAALCAASLARAGWTVLQLDLLGCGDSSGDFADASWDAWLADLDAAYLWLGEQGFEHVVLWGLRAGALLISDWLSRTDTGSHAVILWQPVGNGKQHLNQFLRLKGVSGMLDEHDAKAVMAAMRADIDAGKAVEVAGYTLGSELCAGLEAAKLSFRSGFHAPVRLLELNSVEPATCSPAIVMLAERAAAQGVDIVAKCVHGPSFWQTQEIETCEALLDATLVAMDEMHGSH